jgi:hypothetical protein
MTGLQLSTVKEVGTSAFHNDPEDLFFDPFSIRPPVVLLPIKPVPKHLCANISRDVNTGDQAS